MSLDDYLNEKKRARKELDTIEFNIRKAYIAAESALIDDETGLLDREKLKDEAVQDTFINTYTSIIGSEVRNYFSVPADANLPDSRMDALVKAYSGITFSQFGSIVRDAQDNLSMDGYLKTIAKPFKEVQERIVQSVIGKLKMTDKDAVFDWLRKPENEPALNVIDIAKVNRVEYLADLVNMYEENGVIPAKALKDKPYVR